jgi:formylglycine-generating enzyme required for sulfatase activity
VLPCLALAQSAAPLQPALPRSLRVEPQPACQFDAARGPEMVVIEGGTFLMGSPEEEERRSYNEGPQHRVTVPSFAMGRCEVTVDQFQQFVEETAYSSDAETGSGCDNPYNPIVDVRQRREVNWRKPGFEQRGAHPVVCVSFRDAQAYIAWLNQRSGQAYRLPTDAEWEYAARAGYPGRFSFGDDLDVTAQCEYANAADESMRRQPFAESYVVDNCDDGYGFTAPVAALKPNGFGLYDMHGNAEEWVKDCIHAGYSGAPDDGSAWQEQGEGDCIRRVVRGGGWNVAGEFLRSARRGGMVDDAANNSQGFRLARTL